VAGQLNNCVLPVTMLRTAGQAQKETKHPGTASHLLECAVGREEHMRLPPFLPSRRSRLAAQAALAVEARRIRSVQRQRLEGVHCHQHRACRGRVQVQGAG